MKIGFSKIDITPPLGTAMAGQLLNYKAKGIESRLFATGMCIDDGMTVVIMVACDVLIISNETVAEIRTETQQVTGVPADNIIICTTHTHSGPMTQAIFGMEAEAKYTEDMKHNIVASAGKAFQIRRDGSLHTANGKLAGYAFNRRFIMSDGTIETHPLKRNPHIVRAEGSDSEDVSVLYAVDGSGRPMGAAVSFGCHATVMERGNELISSDYPGKVAEYVSSALNAPVLFLQGACGNICQVNPYDDLRCEVGLEWVKTMGKAIGQKALELINARMAETSGRIRVITETVEIPRRAVPPELVAWAKRHKDIPADTPQLSDYGTELYGQIGPPKVSLIELFKTPFWANFYSDEIKTRERDRIQQPKMPLTIKVIAQDNWAMVTVPCELFVEWGNLIRQKSPFEYTFVVELANGWNGYIPTKQAFTRAGGYETKEVTSTMLVPEAGDILFNKVIEMLQKAKNIK